MWSEMTPSRRTVLSLLAGLVLVVLVQATAWLPDHDRERIDEKHRETCRGNLLGILREPGARPPDCPADGYAELRPADRPPYPPLAGEAHWEGERVLAYCPRHEPGILVLLDSGRVRLVRWEELGLRNRIMAVIQPEPRHPLLKALGYR